LVFVAADDRGLDFFLAAGDSAALGGFAWPSLLRAVHDLFHVRKLRRLRLADV